MKNLNVKKNRKKKHYASNYFQFSKSAKMKIDVNVVETTKKRFLKKKNVNFQREQTNKKRIEYRI